jgi:hypothetical protein
MGDSMWNVTLCDMRINLKQLWEAIHEIFWVKIVLEVFKNDSKGPFTINVACVGMLA